MFTGDELTGFAAIISAVGSAIAAVLAGVAMLTTRRTHDLVNGQSNKLNAANFEAGKAAQRDEDRDGK